MIYRLYRLRHHAVIRRHNQYSNVGNLSSARPHGSECLVARSIEEHDLFLTHIYVISTYMLSYTACFTRNYVRFSDIIK